MGVLQNLMTNHVTQNKMFLPPSLVPFDIYVVIMKFYYAPQKTIKMHRHRMWRGCNPRDCFKVDKGSHGIMWFPPEEPIIDPFNSRLYPPIDQSMYNFYRTETDY